MSCRPTTGVTTDMGVTMVNAPHPGEALRSLCMEPLGRSVTEAAKALGASRKTLSSLPNGRAGISPERAVRLAIAFARNAKSWLRPHPNYDLWHAEKRRKTLRVKRLAASATVAH